MSVGSPKAMGSMDCSLLFIYVSSKLYAVVLSVNQHSEMYYVTAFPALPIH